MSTAPATQVVATTSQVPSAVEAQGSVDPARNEVQLVQQMKLRSISRHHCLLLRGFNSLAQLISSEPSETWTAYEINVRKSRFPELLEKINESHWNEIDTVTSDEAVEELEDRLNEAQNKYFELSSIIGNRLEHSEPQTEPEPLATGRTTDALESQQLIVNVNMPVSESNHKNTWGKFDGNLSN